MSPGCRAGNWHPAASLADQVPAGKTVRAAQFGVIPDTKIASGDGSADRAQPRLAFEFGRVAGRVVVVVGRSTGGGEVVRYAAQYGRDVVVKVVTVGAVPPIMVKPESTPEGTPIEAFDGIRQGVLNERSQFYRDLSEPFFGAYRPPNTTACRVGLVSLIAGRGICPWGHPGDAHFRGVRSTVIITETSITCASPVRRRTLADRRSWRVRQQTRSWCQSRVGQASP